MVLHIKERGYSMIRLYCIPRLDHLSDFVSFAQKYHAGFEYNDFFLPSVLDNPEKVDSLIQTYLALDRDRSEDTLHGVFLDICVHSDDASIYAASDRRIHQSMDIALRLGIKAVIFHTNFIPNFRLKSYRENWLNRNVAYWKTLLDEYPTLEVYLENMFDEEPDMLCMLAEALKDEPRFGVCYDFAHAYISHTPLSEWNHALSHYAKHLHINDNDKEEDSHHPVGSRSLPWEQYQEFINTIPEAKRPSVLIEVQNYENLMASVSYMEAHGLYPFSQKCFI